MMFGHCWTDHCICNPAPAARRGHQCVGWKHLSMLYLLYYHYMPFLDQGGDQPCLVAMDSLARLVHPDTAPCNHGLLQLFAKQDWLGLLQCRSTNTDMAQCSLICAASVPADETFQHYVDHHGFLDAYGPLFSGMWIKLHLAHATFVTPCTLCDLQYPKLPLKSMSQRPVIVQLAHLHPWPTRKCRTQWTCPISCRPGAHGSPAEDTKRKRSVGGEETEGRNTKRITTTRAPAAHAHSHPAAAEARGPTPRPQQAGLLHLAKPEFNRH